MVVKSDVALIARLTCYPTIYCRSQVKVSLHTEGYYWDSPGYGVLQRLVARKKVYRRRENHQFIKRSGYPDGGVLNKSLMERLPATVCVKVTHTYIFVIYETLQPVVYT